MKETFVPYNDNGTHLEGFSAYPSEKKTPLVILCHAWKGRDEFICEKARSIADLGYVGFALDMYGKGILGTSKTENAALKKPFLDDRGLLQKRVLKAFEVSSQLPYVDSNRVAVVGFGFGGICALDLARAGVNLLGAISVYGHFEHPPLALTKPIKAKVLILHGYNDPVTPQQELHAFEKEMNDSKVDWQTHLYGGTMHAFATPAAHDPTSGILYNPVAAKRSWQAIQTFLHEVFNDPKDFSS
jgi:dienelactone hydrolase